MTLERLTQITSVGISSGITLSSATLTGVTTLTTLSAGGDIDAVNGTFSGNLNVAGVLTYEDVSNVDSIGIITARNGLNVTGGNVGIGTDNPAGLLHVSSGTSGDATLILEADTDNNAEGDNPIILFRQDGGGDQSAIGQGVNRSGGSDNNALVFSNSVSSSGGIIFETGTSNGYTNSTERLRIASNGKVGIGSVIPTEILDVSGTGDMKMVVHTEDSGAGNNAGVRIATGDGYKWLLQVGDSTTSGGLRIYQETSGSNGERLRVTSAGKVFLPGTQTDSDEAGRLDIYHTADDGINNPHIRLWGPANQDARIEFGSPTNTGEGGYIMYNDSDEGLYIGSRMGGYGEVNLCTGMNDGSPTSNIRLRIDSSGRVTMPYQPGFFALGTGSATATASTGATQDLGPEFTTIPTVGGFNTGSHYNTTTGVFTAPVAGKYFTFFNIRWETGLFVQNSYIRIFVSINNSNSQYYIHQINGTNEAWNNYMAMSCCGVVDLAAGDTLRPKGGMSGGTAYAYWNESSWGAWLLG